MGPSGLVLGTTRHRLPSSEQAQRPASTRSVRNRAKGKPRINNSTLSLRGLRAPRWQIVVKHPLENNNCLVGHGPRTNTEQRVNTFCEIVCVVCALS